MGFENRQGVRCFTFDSMHQPGLVQAVFTRQGGVSPTPWDSLNVGSTVGDDLARVAENKQRSLAAAGRDPDSIFDVWQVHGRDVVSTSGPRPRHSAHQKADAILTGEPGVTLYMRFADCVPVLLYDPVRRVAGLVHAGWQGTVLRTAAAAVERMRAEYGSHPEEILAGIGPSIGPDHYEVGVDVIRQVQAAFPQHTHDLLQTNGSQERAHLDLWLANQVVLEEAGVKRIETAGLCTACDLDHWYSHRAEKGRTGRFGALIALQ
jgi:polyphenol oxidase